MKKCETNVKQIIEEQQKIKEKYGYFIHCVYDDNETDIVDVHTHGLLEKGRLELQIKLNINPEVSKNILNDIIILLENNELNIQVDNVIDDKRIFPRPIAFKLAKDDFNDNIIRVILPDAHGKFPWDDKCNTLFAPQWTDEDEVIYIIKNIQYKYHYNQTFIKSLVSF